MNILFEWIKQVEGETPDGCFWGLIYERNNARRATFICPHVLYGMFLRLIKKPILNIEVHTGSVYYRFCVFDFGALLKLDGKVFKQELNNFKRIYDDG
jgi:hypothetical protein